MVIYKIESEKILEAFGNGIENNEDE